MILALQAEGLQVARYQMTSHPNAYSGNAGVMKLVREKQMDALPIISGKGGVSKTCMACTQAVRSAGQGLRTLIVTTDPASNLAGVFKQPRGRQVTPITGVPHLFAIEIDSE